MRCSSTQKNQGYLLVYLLVYMSIFVLILTAGITFFVSQKRLVEHRYNSQRALEIAEAGLNYYKWYLAHYPDDVTNGTGLPGPYVHEYSDPEDGVIGEFSLEIASSTYCGDVSSIEVRSTGYTFDATSTERTLYARYSLPTVSEYAYIINSNVWAGSDRTIIGPYHSNNGIRMDGTNNSVVTSGVEDWICTSSYGCSPSQTVDGVFGSGPNSSLWSFPSAPINFTGLTVDLAQMKDRAENAGGIYLGPSGDQGYRVDFINDSTIDVYRVDSTYSYWGYSSDDGWQPENNVIYDNDFITSYTINEDCPLIFVEDDLWIEGEVPLKVSIAAADVDTAGVDPSIILNDDITYPAGSDGGLLAIAEENVLVGLVVPDDMYLNGIFIAQNGRFGRNYYQTSGYYDVHSSHNSYVCRNSLTMNGTIVSAGRVGTKWTGSNCGSYGSGFEDRYNSYDRDLVNDPPPLVPNTSDVYEYIEWREVE